MHRILYTHSFNKRASKFFKKHPELIGQYEKILRLIEVNIHHPSLRLHRLKGKLSDLHSISINISYRITIELLVEKSVVIPVDIGSHDELYG